MNRIERLLYRLRHMRTKSVCYEAADEIERLRELLEECMPYLDGGVQYMLGNFPRRDKVELIGFYGEDYDDAEEKELIQKYNEMYKKLQKELDNDN